MTAYAPAGSVLECKRCSRPLYRLLADRELGQVVMAEHLEACEGVAAPVQGEVIRCPQCGPSWPRLRRPDGTTEAEA